MRYYCMYCDDFKRLYYVNSYGFCRYNQMEIGRLHNICGYFKLRKKCTEMNKIKRSIWKNHLVCTECGRVYDKEKSNMIVEKQGNRCYCGALFAPTKKNDETEEQEKFSAAPICPECYNKEIKQKRGF